jgi:hypothetical protein
LVIEDPKTRRELAQQGRLWLLSLVCAGVGAVTISRTGSLSTGVVAFLISLVVLGPVLWLFERQRKKGRSQR